LAGGWWHSLDDASRIVCDLCPRACSLKPGDRGFCFVRENVAGEMILSTYGRSTGFCIDPIEKKPLNHFYPGTSVLSFGTAGCNLGCKFCQNWDISKSREIERLSERATPEMIARAAVRLEAASVAFTYNDPVVWAEYAIDTARACRALGVKTVAVTAGYITPAARGPFYEVMDAANVDLKGFTEDFYQHYTLSHLKPVLDTLVWLKQETDVWFEVTNLVIPRANDSPDEIRQMCDWLLTHLGDQVPVHFTAFHPDFRLMDRPRTPAETLVAAYDAARAAGLKYVYVGNVNDVERQSTYCGGCGRLVIERDWYRLGRYNLDFGRCRHCGFALPGRFMDGPGHWGARRLPVRIGDFDLPASGKRATENSPESLPPVPRRDQPSSAAPPDEPSSTMNTAAGSATSSATWTGHPPLSDRQTRAILEMSARVLAAQVTGRPAAIHDPGLSGAAGLRVRGAFVSLKREGHLRTCVGFQGEGIRLFDAVAQAAQRAASHDARFPVISPTELEFLDVEVWILYGTRRLAANGIDRAAEVEIGRHGLEVAWQDRRGLLLPAVAVEMGLDAAGFLDQVCLKAGIAPFTWQDEEAMVATFEGWSVKAALGELLAAEDKARPVPKIKPADAAGLADAARLNIADMLQGATPAFFVPGAADGNVQGLALTIRGSEGKYLQTSRLALRPTVPLQSTLFTLCESAAAALRSQGATAAAVRGARVELGVLFDPAMHGTVGAPDLRGFDPRSRALVVLERQKSAWIHDPSKAAHELLDELAREANVAEPDAAFLYSLGVASNVSRMLVSKTARTTGGPAVRPPAVAGRFYPNDAAELSRMVQELFAGPGGQVDKWPAVMVPHAGLMYSGRLAAEVFRRVEVPETVIVIGPKHTPFGVEWAVAPHETWQLPGFTMASSPGLAHQLCEAIDGLELDAAAHREEHGTEVELPLIAQRNPRAAVVAVALGSGGLDRLQEFGRGLARVVASLPTRPLLVISSDMNHFANDEDTRRLDAIALEALESRDPVRLYETVTRLRISMCGLGPAVAVLTALGELGGVNQVERVGYATSADVSGDKTRVVGYAGALVR
jgi:AmmeMemoRadiSam system radical SAM enzyme/AmmeMemoRadiSam system protein B/AmmeMemoRadiSam system protein A